MSAAELSSGKGHTDENFPVASFLIAPRHRGVILAFYRFARAADDIADHAGAAPEEKLRLLEEMRLGLLGLSGKAGDAVKLRTVLLERNLTLDHALDLLEAFRRDVTKLRYADWGELMDYCRYSAMPVGRFVLDVHGEARSTWPESDALCAALQVINHLQDCAKDFRDLDRIYLPLDDMGKFGVTAQALAQPKASTGLRGLIADLSGRTAGLLVQAKGFAGQIRNHRLALEVSVIQALAEDLDAKLMRRDPLSERVHHRKIDLPEPFLLALTRFLATRLRFKSSGP